MSVFSAFVCAMIFLLQEGTPQFSEKKIHRSSENDLVAKEEEKQDEAYFSEHSDLTLILIKFQIPSTKPTQD